MGEVISGSFEASDSPSDVKTGVFIGDQVPQQLTIVPHTVLHIHLCLLNKHNNA